MSIPTGTRTRLSAPTVTPGPSSVPTGRRLTLERMLVLGASGAWTGHVFADLGDAAMSSAVVPLTVLLVPALALCAALDRMSPGARALGCLAAGVAPTANGGVHLTNASVTGMVGPEVSGLGALVAGVIFIGIGVLNGHRHIRAATTGRGRRLLVTMIAVTVAVPGLVLPAAVAVVQTHRWHDPRTPRPDASYRDVTFGASDGVQLSGWYRPSTTGAAIVLVATAGGSRDSVLSRAELLVRHGYGVLVYDSRGSGASDGPHNAYGWDWAADVQGAVHFLTTQPDVDPDRIGALGLSTGADVLIEVAADEASGLAAVIAEGATARSTADLGSDYSLAGLHLRAMFLGVRLLSPTTTPDRSLVELAASAKLPLFLIAGGSIPQEIPFNTRYAEAAGARLWALPYTAHTRALADQPEQYEQRVTEFLDRALLS